MKEREEKHIGKVLIWFNSMISDYVIRLLVQPNKRPTCSQKVHKQIQTYLIWVLQLKPLSGFIMSQQTFLLQIGTTFHPKLGR